MTVAVLLPVKKSAILVSLLLAAEFWVVILI
jgi:hypothetical protein